jgi:hypothetical protein
MKTNKYNPPFRNETLSDFFDYQCEISSITASFQEWVGDQYPDLVCSLMYCVPMFKYNNKNIFYLQYTKKTGDLELKIHFGKGNLITDRYDLFEEGPKVYKSINIISMDEKFLFQLSSYINQAIKLVE